MDNDEFARPTPRKIEDSLCELRRHFVDQLEEIDPKTILRTLRLFDVWRQVSLRRIVDLAQGAELFFFEGRLIPACTLTRSVVETVAMLYLVWKKLDAQVKSGDLSESHTLLMSAVFGRRDKGKDWPNQSMNVLTAIGHLDKQFPGFESEYTRLSEYLHPGLAGGYGAYVRTEGDGMRSHFGQNPLGLEMDSWGRGELEMALLVATTFNNLLTELRPRIISKME